MPYARSFKIKGLKKQIGSRRDHPRRKKLFLMIFLACFLLTGLGFTGKHLYHQLSQWDFFQITAVRINGNLMTSKEQIAALSRVDIHSNLLALDVSQIRALLESHPWIAKAEIIRDWPNMLLINLKEKSPVALINRSSGLFYLDNTGHMIAAAAPSQELDFPVITGLENFVFSAAHPGRIPAPLLDVFDLLKLANRNNPILPEQSISEIHVTANGELILYLLDRPFPIYLGTDGKISTRYYRLVKVLKNLYKTREFSEVSYIRLDYQKDAILVGKRETGRIQQG